MIGLGGGICFEAVAGTSHSLSDHYSNAGSVEEVLESQVNESCSNGCSISERLDIDHVTLRRYLIDERYLFREADGAEYTVNPAGRSVFEFEDSISGIDPFVVISRPGNGWRARQSLRARSEQSEYRANDEITSGA
jgi:hypothetical protein